MTHTCANEACRKAFESPRPNALYCSGSCRAQASRARRGHAKQASAPKRAPRKVPPARHPERPSAEVTAAADQRLAAMERRLAEIEAKVEDLPTRREVEVIWEEMENLRREVDAGEFRLREAEQRLGVGSGPLDDTFESRLRDLEQHCLGAPDLGGLRKRLSAIEARQYGGAGEQAQGARLREKVQEIESSLAELWREHNELITKMLQFAEQLEEILS